MTKINVNPTRVSLFKLKKNVTTAIKGHRLLKDKRDELMRKMIEVVKEAGTLRERVDSALVSSMEKMRISAALMGEAELRVALDVSQPDAGFRVSFKNVMNISLPEFSAENEKFYTPASFADAPAELFEAVFELQDIKKDLLRLAGLEKAAALISAEIERISRRVNALEYVLIPDYKETIAYIKMRLEENERANSIRLLKVKDMVIERKGM